MKGGDFLFATRPIFSAKQDTNITQIEKEPITMNTDLPELLLALLKTVLALLALAASSERGVQVIKTFLNMLTAKLSWLNLSGKRSFLLAAVVAWLVTYFFHIDITSYLHILDGYDPALVTLVNSLLVLLFSNKLHDKFFPGNPS